MFEIRFLLPDEVGPWLALLLVAMSLAASAVSAALSLGGGSIMLAVLAMIVPQQALIPVHGVLQLGSNFSRALFLREHLQWIAFGTFALASLVGAIVGGLVALQLPAGVMLGGLGLFILWSVWGRMPRFITNAGLTWGGFASSILTMFVGATGPFMAAVLRPLLADRRAFVAVHAACMTIQHTFKLGVFATLGFEYLPYVPLMAAMIAAGFAGSWLGKRVLVRLGDERFQIILRAILTVAALRLLWIAIS